MAARFGQRWIRVMTASSVTAAMIRRVPHQHKEYFNAVPDFWLMQE